MSEKKSKGVIGWFTTNLPYIVLTTACVVGGLYVYNKITDRKEKPIADNKKETAADA